MSLTKEDMQMLSAMMDQKFNKMSTELGERLEEKLEKKLDEKLEEKLEKKLDEKLEEKLEKKLDEKLEEKLEKKLNEKLDSRLSAELARFENRLMLRVSNMMDLKLKAALDPLENRMTDMELRMNRIEVDLLENNVIPRIKHIESCYVSTYKRYEEYADKMDAVMLDMDVMKKVMMDDHAKQPALCAEQPLYERR